jgi:TPR repeat protein
MMWMPSAGVRAMPLVLALVLLAAPAWAQDNAASMRDAANRGDAGAQYKLAEAYLMGDAGLKEDDAEAARWARKSADQHNADAEALLAGLYLDGTGVPKDEGKAIALLDDSMGQKNGVAFFLAGRIARAHPDKPDHDAKANFLFRIGAYLGNRTAMAALGEAFEQGEGVKPDPVQAYVWYGVAVAQFAPDHVPPALAGWFGAAAQRLNPTQEKIARDRIGTCLASDLRDCGAPDVPKELVK